MKNILMLALMISLVVAVDAVGKKTTDQKRLAMNKTFQDSVIARIDGKDLHFSDLAYDRQKRYDFELFKLKEKLYREQKVKLNTEIDQMLLEKEAESRKMTPDELMTMINSKAKEGENEVPVDKETAYQDFLDTLKKRYPDFSAMSEDKQLEMLKGMLGIGSGYEGSLKEEVKNKIVEVNKRSHRHNGKNKLLKELRAKAEVEILLERPELIRLTVSPDDDPYLGKKDAKITLLEFADYQCPACSRVRPMLKELVARKGDTIKVVFRDLPLASHKNARAAAEAAECADEQGKFWEYHEFLFENQQSLDGESLKKYAESIGLDAKKFNQCIDSGRYSAEVEKDVADAKIAGINSTPSILVNGYYISGIPTVAYLEEVIADIESGKIPKIREDAGKG
jgi:protein-disulfide isomerase